MPELDSRAPGERLKGRRRFTVQMAVALLGGAAISIGCGGGGSPSSPAPVPTPTPSPSGPTAATGAIAENHGHVATISGAQLAAGGALTLSIVGMFHTHTLTLSSDEVIRIRGGERVARTSSNEIGQFGPHDHTITFN